MLLNLEKAGALQGRSLLDVGCGTGFLGILARMAGCSSVVLADKEEGVVETATLNVTANDIQDVRVRTIEWGDDDEMETDGRSDNEEKFDVLLLSEVLYVARPMCVPWTLDPDDVYGLGSTTKARLKP